METKYKGREEEYRKEYYKNNKDKWKEYRENGSYNCVYRFIDEDGNIIRIGSTGNGLRIRIANYMSERVFKGWGIWKFFNTFKVVKIEFIMLDTREKSYCLESLLLKKYNPLLNQNEVRTDYYDTYIDSLGDINNIEDLWEEWEGLDYYREKYKSICNKNL